ncbi:hypothetical protein [Leptothermofonsia sp. ETS-13]
MDEEALRSTGVDGIMQLPDRKLHLLVGLNADQHAEEMKKQLAKV